MQNTPLLFHCTTLVSEYDHYANGQSFSRIEEKGVVTHGRSRRISQLPAVREAKARIYVCFCWVRIGRSKFNLTVSDLLIEYFLNFFGIWEQCNKSRMLSLLLFQFFFWPALKKA